MIMKPLRTIPFYLLALIVLCALGLRAQQTQAPPPAATPQSAAPPAAGQDMKETVTVEDVARTFVVHLPKSYDSKQKYPVVLILHDADNDALDMIRLSRFDATADEHGVIAVYPNALRRRWTNLEADAPQQNRGGYGGRHGGMGGGGMGGGGMGGGMGRQRGGQGGGGRGAGRQSGNDLAFFNAMLDQLDTEYSVDDSRVFATGFSDGGFMDFQLGCNLANRIAAIAPVGAEMAKSQEEFCKNWTFRPVALLMINGTEDPVLPYKGRSAPPSTISAPDTAKDWAKTAGCAKSAQRTTLPPRASGGLQTNVDSYSDCTQGTEVMLYSIVDGGHFWPGGEQPYVPANKIGKSSDDLEANELIWKFFAAHPMPARQ
jgi:polyhydroxybutyrate depolymerase